MAASSSREELTGLLRQWREGRSPDERLIQALESELRRIAHAYMRRERGDHTLQPTALVNEAYLRLLEGNGAEWTGRAHFYGIAARVMRQVLVDHARKRVASKRGVALRADVPISKVADPAGGADIDVLALQLALEALADLDPRQAQIVELRYFGGMTEHEVAQAMQLSPATIRREVASARLFLGRKMRQG